MMRKLLHLMLDLVLLAAWIALAIRTHRQGQASYVFTFLAGNSLVDLGNSWKALTGGGGTASPTSPPKWMQRLITGG
jgi:hypothetical protein